MTVAPLGGEPLPSPESIGAAVFMGGPMSVNDTGAHPALADEVRWIQRALELGLPLLGVCLGSQLIARALGAEVAPAASGVELGWAPVRVHDADDPVLGPLAPGATVLHWHGEAFDLPAGATLLASSEMTACQAFRAGNAWGVLFHPEADAELVEKWLAEPAMAAEAEAVLGAGAGEVLMAGAVGNQADLAARSSTGFETFAALAL